ncbi:acyl-CoA N-acyltransferase [Pseudoneurospora amorphoporcata]|uniref:Acyl-CoA N-acyltransferase n=1 Tax=Pseudoneurospora amorphoporcata TaxID=241081 RepID=A0AAN6NNL5_9PEZI|nr:acyl-CoA N-acyltransferase [Pseudoneurospora amorphoporcata]
MTFIRPFKPRDAEACMHICIATLPPTLAADEIAARMSPYIWCLQFTTLSPQTCFVLVDNTNSSNPEDGEVVGYVIGTPNVHAFATSYSRYIAEVLQTPQDLHDVPPPKQLDTLESWLLPFPVPETDSASGEKKEVLKVNTESLAQHAYNPKWLVLEGPEGGKAEHRRKELVEGWRAMLHIDLLEGWQGKGWGRRMIERFCEAVKTSGADYGKGVYLGVNGENTKVVKFYEKVGFKVFEGGEVEGSVWMVRDL